MNNLTGISILGIGDADRVAFTYDVIDTAGDLVSENIKKSFFVADAELKSHIDAIKSYITENKMGE